MSVIGAWRATSRPYMPPQNSNLIPDGRTRHVRSHRRPAPTAARRCVITDELRRLAYGTDGSFYRLIPEVVAVVNDETEVRDVTRIARDHGRPVTFRAAGTSLCGQAVTDGVLVLLGEGLATCHIGAGGTTVQVGPAIVGAEVNRRLAPLGRKIGPDPASINAAKIGGIAANNSSGMCCGTAQNSYNTLAAIRVMLADGTLLDTGEAASVAAFKASHGGLLDSLGGWPRGCAPTTPWPAASAPSTRSRTPPATASTPWWTTPTRWTSWPT
jgi:FAD/FMN-containing dehydrogenase